MPSSTDNDANKALLMHAALITNAAVCAVIGSCFILFADAIAIAIIGLPNGVIPAVGGAFLVHAFHLLIADDRRRAIASELMYFACCNFAWIVLTLILSTAPSVTASLLGTIGLLVMASGAGLFGMAQLSAYKRLAGYSPSTAASLSM